ncbi:sphingosine kinase [Malassezia obtusa]|uniref:Sphingosine kinase n=1 Tax=Malassezia obtusa TaxID=76774 RepID=A0AAF0E6A7_9BASI|nr:sphingosine kinase [Malassezia obtusa]
MGLPELEGRVHGARATACVRDAQLVVRTNTDLVDLPVELVLHAALETTPEASRIRLHLLAPASSRTHPRACLGASAQHAKLVLPRARWRQRDTDDAVARLEHATLALDVPPAETPAARAWVDQLLAHAYPEAARKRVLVIANPVGGQGKGKHVLDRIVAPLLRAADCAPTVFETRGRADAFRYVSEMRIADFDVLLCVGGDGTVHEVVNALAARADAADALRLPVVPVPCGSGNGMYLSLHGPRSFNVPLACLSALKGRAHAQELCVLTQEAVHFADGHPIYPIVGHGRDGRAYVQYYSFLSQAIGLMADIDLGTERYRFLGDLRFSLGYVLGALRNRRCKADIDVVLGTHGSTDLAQMRERALREAPRAAATTDAAHRLRHGAVVDAIDAQPAPLDFGARAAPTGRWLRVSEDISTLYGGKMPFVARSLMAFPYASPADGALDIMVQTHASSAVEKLVSVLHGEHGDHILDSSIRYFKAEAYRVTPHASPGQHYLSIDGEMVPHAPFQVEVSPLQLTLLSLDDDEWRAPILQPPTAREHARRAAARA